MVPVIQLVRWSDLGWVKAWRARAAARKVAHAARMAEKAKQAEHARNMAMLGGWAEGLPPARGTCSTPENVQQEIADLRVELAAIRLLTAGPLAPAQAAAPVQVPIPGSVESIILQDKVATALRAEFTELRVEFGDGMARAARDTQQLVSRLTEQLQAVETLAANTDKRVDSAEQAVASSGVAATSALALVENRMAAHVDAQLKKLQDGLLTFGDVLGKLDTRVDGTTARFMAIETRADELATRVRASDAASAGAVATVARLDEEMKALVGSNAALAPMWAAMRDSVTACLEAFAKAEKNQETISSTVDEILSSLAKRNLLDS